MLHAVQIANTTDQEAELFFQTNTDGRSEEQMNMLKKVRFEISQNKKSRIQQYPAA